MARRRGGSLTMGGICGVVQLGGTPRPVVEPHVLDRMTDLLRHRGPDGRGTYLADGIALGARVRAGNGSLTGQPLTTDDGSVRCVVDGELYGTERELSALPHLFDRLGPGFEAEVRGKFAIAVWDSRRRRAAIVRDRLGLKPLYYAITDDLVVFGSELKSVLASGLVPADLDYEAIDAYLTLGYFPTPRTPLRAVQKLTPGCRIVVDGEGARVERYWAFPKPALHPPDRDERDYAASVLDALEQSVRLHLRGEDRAAAVLSGGLDSSLVVALLARNTTRPVQTFTVGFAEAGADNEIQGAADVSRFFGAEHHALELSYSESAVDLQQLSWHLDEPLADLSSLGLFALCELAGQHTTSVFSGQGSDQLFGGYRKHSAAAIVGRWQRFPGMIGAARLVPESLIPRRLTREAGTLRAADAAERLVAMSGRTNSELRHRLARNELAALDGRAGERVVRSRLDGVPDDPLAAALYLDSQLELVDDLLHYFDRATMAHALEVRVPFLDHDFVELTATIPPSLKVNRRRNKHVLRLAADGILPPRVVNDKQKTKIGFFHSAVDTWFRSQVEGAVSEYLLDDRLACSDFLDQRELRKAVRRHFAGTGSENTYGLFSILMLEIWLSSYLPRALSAQPA